MEIKCAHRRCISPRIEEREPLRLPQTQTRRGVGHDGNGWKAPNPGKHNQSAALVIQEFAAFMQPKIIPCLPVVATRLPAAFPDLFSTCPHAMTRERHDSHAYLKVDTAHILPLKSRFLPARYGKKRSDHGRALMHFFYWPARSGVTSSESSPVSAVG